MVSRLVCAGLIVLVCPWFPRAAQAASNRPPTSTGAVRFDSHAPGETVVKVTIDGQGPFRFLLDTGSSHSAVAEALVARLEAPPVARTTMTTATGTIECLVVRLTSVAIGSAVAEELLPTVLPAASLALLGERLDGVIGQDFLSARNYTIDFRQRQLVWGDTEAPAGADRLPLRSINDRPLVELPQPSGETIVLVPDSGATHLVVFNPQRFRFVPERLSGMRVNTLGGSEDIRSVVIHSLAVGRRTLSQVRGGLLDGGTFGPERGDGLLPLHIFDRVYFNNSEGYMALQ